MPSTYAHYRFGTEVYRRLPPEWRRRIDASYHLYCVGLHGPDILFYYKPLHRNAVNKVGYLMHGWTGQEFFTRGIRLAELSPHPEEAWSYLLGCLCHFILDSFCHPYVEEKIARSHVYHTEIEGAFDRVLMTMDGLDPLTHRLTDHVLPDRTEACIIAPFFTPVSAEQVYEATRSFILLNQALLPTSKLKRAAVSGLLLVTGNYGEMHGMMMTSRRNPCFADSDERLYALYQKGIEESLPLFNQLADRKCGRGDLGPRFRHTFGVD